VKKVFSIFPDEVNACCKFHFRVIASFLIQCASMGFDPNRRSANVVVSFVVLYIKQDRTKANESFVFHYNLLLLGSISSNPVFKPLSFFLSDRRTLNSTRFDLRRRLSGWALSLFRRPRHGQMFCLRVITIAFVDVTCRACSTFTSTFNRLEDR
jgi:hypothetical protein